MIKLLLIRYNKNQEYTEGELFNRSNGDVRICDTLEDRVRNYHLGEEKVYGKSAIPYGEYKIKVTYSPAFKRPMVAILDVPMFEGVRMHWGLTADNSSGCVLCGKRSGEGILSNIGMTDYLVDLLMKNGNEGKILIE